MYFSRLRGLGLLTVIFFVAAGAAAAGAAELTAPAALSVWGKPEIDATRKTLHASAAPPGKPAFAGDPLNLLLVDEDGGRHLTLLDGDRLEPLARLASRGAAVGAPRFTPDGHFAFVVTREGWVTKYDLFAPAAVVEVRVGLDTSAIAVSADGRWVLAGNAQPPALVLLAASDLSVAKIIPVAGIHGQPSRVSAVYDAAPRGSFIVALQGIPEAWEIPYAANAAPVYEGLVHDYRMGEAVAARGPFPVRRIALDEMLDAFAFDPACDHMIGASRAGDGLVVVNLNVRRTVAVIALPGMDPASAVAWTRRGRPVLAVTGPASAVLNVIDVQTWQLIAAPGTAALSDVAPARTAVAAGYAFVGGVGGAGRDTLRAIDKDALVVAAVLTPAPGKPLVAVVLSRSGERVLAAVGDEDGALVAYDSASLTEVTRLPFRLPAGIARVGNSVARVLRPGG